MAREPCGPDVLAAALAAIEDVEGYRFTQEVSFERPPRRVGDDRVWRATLTRGAVLGDDRYHEEVVRTDEPAGTGVGFLRAMRIGEAAWWLVPADSEDPQQWQEVPPGHWTPLETVPQYLGALELERLEDDPAMVPGRGGCVMGARIAEEGPPSTIAVRIDPAFPRVVAFAAHTDAMRSRLEVSYDVPPAGEFVRPPDVAADP